MKNIQNAESKILPWVQISPAAHFALMESCWGVPSPNPAVMKNGKQHDLVTLFPVFVMLSYWKLPWGVLSLRLLGFVSVEKEMVLYIVYKNACGKI